MRVKEISVTKLFALFNHTIPLKTEDRMTIIHGPNGFGKTALLRMLDAFFNSRWSELRDIPFSEFCIRFDDKSMVRLEKSVELQKEGKHRSTREPLDDTVPKLTLYFTRHGSQEEPYSPQRFTEGSRAMRLSQHLLATIDHELPDLVRIGSNMWAHRITGERLTLNEVVGRYADSLPSRLHLYRPEPDWLEHLRDSIPTRLIETQRLLKYSQRPLEFDEEDGISMVPAVESYSEELSRSIQIKLAEYAALSQSLDRTFPARLVTQGIKSDLTDQEIRNKLDALEKKRSRLMAVGLLDKAQEDFQVSQQIDERTKSVLAVYVADVERKLQVFDEMADKIEFLSRIVNQRFRYKQMTVSKERGFTFTTTDHNELAPADLSSGEQHELVLFYELLFVVKPGSLILIDEPELSLHVAWQMEFLKDLQQTTRLNDFDVLIATHSPQIINDRWDLTVTLEGPAE